MTEQNITAFKLLFHEYHALLCNVANNIIRDRVGAEDIVQEVFLNLWKRRDDISWDKSLKGYLYQSTVNSALNWLEKNKKTVLFDTAVTLETVKYAATSVEEALEEQELLKIAQQAIDALPPKCKAIFVLSRYEGMKYHEIASHLQISVKTVESQMTIALKRLYETLMPYLKIALFLFFRNFL